MHGLAAAAFALMYSLGGSAMALLGGHAHMTSALLSGLFTPPPPCHYQIQATSDGSDIG